MKYQLLDKLGDGGYGEVFRARDKQTNRLVALKVLALRADDPEDEERFKAEAEIHARLDHANIVQIYETDAFWGNRKYIAMQLVAGSLSAKLGDEKLRDPSVAARLISKVAAAIQYAHDRGVTHCDLKPANILLDPDGVPFVTDFGIGQMLDRGRRNRALMGTLEYMAPEQCQASDDDDDAPLQRLADIWALGAILYELVSGRPPYAEAKTLAERNALFASKTLPPALSKTLRRYSLGRKPDDDLDRILACALAIDPVDRYPSASALADDLDRWVHDLPIAGPARVEPSFAKYALRFIRRNVGVVACVVGPVFACLSINTCTTVSGLSQQKQTYQTMNRVVADLDSRILSQAIRDSKTWISALAQEAVVRRMLPGGAMRELGPPAADDISKFWQTLASSRIGRSGADQFYILDPNGCIVQYFPTPGPEKVYTSWYGFRDYFGCSFRTQQSHDHSHDACLAGVFRSEYDLYENTLRMAISAPVYDDDGSWIGVLVASWPADGALGSIKFGPIPNAHSTTSMLVHRDLERQQAEAQLARASLRPPTCKLAATTQPEGTATAKDFIAALKPDARLLSIPRDGLGNESFLEPQVLAGASGGQAEYFRDPRDGRDYLAAFSATGAQRPPRIGVAVSGDARGSNSAASDAPIVVASTDRAELANDQLRTLGPCLALWLVTLVPLGLLLVTFARAKRTGTWLR
jgi:serine/threonine protein kinase